MRLGFCLRSIRRQAGLTQEEVAQRMGLRSKGSKSFVSSLEAGRVKDPRFRTVVLFVSACGAPWGEFWAGYEPPPGQRVNARAIEQTSFSPGDKQALNQRFRDDAYKYGTRSVRGSDGRPLAPEVREKAQERFEDYRQSYRIVEMAVRQLLGKETFPRYQYFAWLDITQRVFSVVRRYREDRWPERFERTAALVREWQLDEGIFRRLKEVVIEQYRKLRGGST